MTDTRRYVTQYGLIIPAGMIASQREDGRVVLHNPGEEDVVMEITLELEEGINKGYLQQAAT